MAIKNDRKHLLIIIAALVLLFATRWMYCQLTSKVVGMSDTILFAAQSAFFVLFYAMSVMRASKIALFGCACAGAVLLAVLQGIMGGAFSALAVLAFLPALVFFANQIPAQASRGVVDKITTALLCAFPLVMAVLFVVSIAVNGWNISAKLLYYPVALIAIAGLYRAAFAAKQPNSRKAFAKNTGDAPAAKIVVIATFFTVILGGLFLVNEGQVLLTHSVLVIWVVNLFVLYERKHSRVSAFSENIKIKIQNLK
ncbi:MAG: hypothetical protein IJI67_05465 [Clostridia bacterium]|nr:hypothetical protein [Clostridia bacterium]